MHGDLHDVGVCGSDLGGEPAQYATLVARDDIQARGEVLGGVGIPRNIDPAFGFTGAQARRSGTVGGVYDQALAQAQASHDRITR